MIQVNRAVNENSTCKGLEVVVNKAFLRHWEKAKTFGHVGSEASGWILARIEGFEGKMMDFGLYPKRKCQINKPCSMGRKLGASSCMFKVSLREQHARYYFFTQII